MKLTLTQKVFRPILRVAVERIFPEGAFYGKRYFRKMASNEKLVKKWGTTEMACALFITSSVRKAGATEAEFEVTDLTDKGVPVGSWRITVEKV